MHAIVKSEHCGYANGLNKSTTFQLIYNGMKLVTIYIFINYSENLHFYDVYLLGTKKTTGINYNHLRNGKHFAENPTLERP